MMGIEQFGRYKRKPKNKRYWAENHRYANKVKRIRKSEGVNAVRRYAQRRNHG